MLVAARSSIRSELRTLTGVGASKPPRTMREPVTTTASSLSSAGWSTVADAGTVWSAGDAAGPAVAGVDANSNESAIAVVVAKAEMAQAELATATAACRRFLETRLFLTHSVIRSNMFSPSSP